MESAPSDLPPVGSLAWGRAWSLPVSPKEAEDWGQVLNAAGNFMARALYGPTPGLHERSGDCSLEFRERVYRLLLGASPDPCEEARGVAEAIIAKIAALELGLLPPGDCLLLRSFGGGKGTGTFTIPHIDTGPFAEPFAIWTPAGKVGTWVFASPGSNSVLTDPDSLFFSKFSLLNGLLNQRVVERRLLSAGQIHLLPSHCVHARQVDETEDLAQRVLIRIGFREP